MIELNIKEFTNGESVRIEYKTDKNNFSDTKIIEAAVAMANAEGGKIFIGIRNDGTIEGSHRLASGFWQSASILEGIILSNTIPSLATRAFKISHENKNIICIEVEKSSTTVGTRHGKYLKRALDSKGNPQNLPMTPDEVVGGYAKVGSIDFSSTILNSSTINDIDLEFVNSTIENLKKQSTHSKDISFFSQEPINFLNSLGLLHENKPNIAALLLFGKKDTLLEKLPNHYVQYQVFGETAEILKNEKFSEPIVELFPKLLELPEINRNSDQFLFRGQNVIIPEYSKEALRESIANALVHRDYSITSGIQIQIYESELITTNPGPLPKGVSIDKLLSAPPTPRNRRLAEAMAKLKFVETSGRGIDFIFYGQAMFGRPTPDYSGSDNDRVSVRLVGGKANLDFCRLLQTIVDKLSIEEMLLLNKLFFQRDITKEEAISTIQKPELYVKQILYKMHNNGLIEISHDPVVRYFLTSKLKQFSSKIIKPERLSPNDIENYSSSLLKSLKRRKNQTTQDLANTVGLSKPQTYRLLKKLERSNKIFLNNQKKWDSN